MTDYGQGFLEPELSHAVLGCLFAVRNKYGRFHRERVYDKALNEQFLLSGIPFIDKPRITIYSVDSGKPIATYVPDKLAGNKIIIELKAQSLVPREELQRATEYLKVSEYQILYFVNFSEPEFSPRRYIFTNDRKPFLASSALSQ